MQYGNNDPNHNIGHSVSPSYFIRKLLTGEDQNIDPDENFIKLVEILNHISHLL